MAVEVVEFDPFAIWWKAYLTPKLQGVRVATKMPNPRVPRLVRIQAAGGGESGSMVLSKRLLIVQAWDESEAATIRLVEKVRGIVYAAKHDPDADYIRDITTVGEPTDFPDPGTALPRYQFTVQALIRGRVITA